MNADIGTCLAKASCAKNLSTGFLFWMGHEIECLPLSIGNFLFEPLYKVILAREQFPIDQPRKVIPANIAEYHSLHIICH